MNAVYGICIVWKRVVVMAIFNKIKGSIPSFKPEVKPSGGEKLDIGVVDEKQVTRGKIFGKFSLSGSSNKKELSIPKRSSKAPSIGELIENELAKMNVGTVSDEDTASLVEELEGTRTTVEVGPSLVFILLGDFLTFAILCSISYLIILQVMNSLTETVLR